MRTLHQATKNVSPQKQNSQNKTFEGIKPCYGTYINTYTSKGGPPFFLAVLSQPFGLEATPVSASALYSSSVR
jgi:hypothetical protein